MVPPAPVDASAERYWTARAASLLERMALATEHMAGAAMDQYLWATASEALTARDPELLCALFRLADARSESATDIRFGMAMRAMERRYYDCAYAAWDDGGRCWSRDEAPRNVPDSRTSASTMKAACESLLAVEAETESSLCRQMRHNASV
eukprot:jgi/Tetstr1/464203/TSEL_009008.t1